jgi:hypothetical protein
MLFSDIFIFPCGFKEPLESKEDRNPQQLTLLEITVTLLKTDVNTKAAFAKEEPQKPKEVQRSRSGMVEVCQRIGLKIEEYKENPDTLELSRKQHPELLWRGSLLNPTCPA